MRITKIRKTILASLISTYSTICEEITIVLPGDKSSQVVRTCAVCVGTYVHYCIYSVLQYGFDLDEIFHTVIHTGKFKTLSRKTFTCKISHKLSWFAPSLFSFNRSSFDPLQVLTFLPKFCQS